MRCLRQRYLGSVQFRISCVLIRPKLAFFETIVKFRADLGEMPWLKEVFDRRYAVCFDRLDTLAYIGVHRSRSRLEQQILAGCPNYLKTKLIPPDRSDVIRNRIVDVCPENRKFGQKAMHTKFIFSK